MTKDRTRRARPTLLVGLSNPETAERLVRLAGRMAETMDAEVLLTHVVTVASQISLTTGRSSPEVVRARDFLQRVIVAARTAEVPTRGLVEVARSVDEGLLAAADSHAVGAILVGYSERQSEEGDPSSEEERFDRVIHRVARKADADVIVAKFRKEAHDSIVVPVAAEAPLGLTKMLCTSLVGDAETRLTFLHVIDPGASLTDARSGLSARLEEAGLLGVGRLEVRVSDAMVDAVVAAVADHDLVILTPSDRPGLLDRVYSSRAEKVAEAVSASAILAWGRQEEG